MNPLKNDLIINFSEESTSHVNGAISFIDNDKAKTFAFINFRWYDAFIETSIGWLATIPSSTVLKGFENSKKNLVELLGVLSFEKHCIKRDNTVCLVKPQESF